MPLPEPDAAIRAAGPWTHRDVAANGARFHVADIGDGPAVLLLHGFPTFWWTWRHALPVLAAAGYRAADDAYAALAKVRYPVEEVVERV